MEKREWNGGVLRRLVLANCRDNRIPHPPGVVKGFFCARALCTRRAAAIGAFCAKPRLFLPAWGLQCFPLDFFLLSWYDYNCRLQDDIFQVVLSNRFDADFEGELLNTYRFLRTINPSPYMFYFGSNDLEIAGASPETLVKLDNGKLYTFPLAGTKPRGKTDEEDRQLERDLLSDEKELAEHNMLVDLGRNDIGRISKFGSVKVEKYMTIERFSHVMHIGSTVVGDIRDDKDSLDAIGSILPAGTLSGAPKIRACEIINELENNKRGIYGGAIGYVDFTGNLDTCIAIRIAFKKNGKVFVRVGAGIVADSVPENEYTECINKSRAVMNALKLSEEEV